MCLHTHATDHNAPDVLFKSQPITFHTDALPRTDRMDFQGYPHINNPVVSSSLALLEQPSASPWDVHQDAQD